MVKNYEQGSVWRRWDLHVHTPDSALANDFDDWDSYVEELELKGGNVPVLGVTDYCSINGYKKLLEYRKRGRLANFALLIPNIEFRTTPETPDGKAINVHVLVDPSTQDHVQLIEQALSALTFEYGGDHYPCTTQGLIRLGRRYDPSKTEELGAFRVGVNQFKIDFAKFRDWLRGQGVWLRNNGLVAIANGKDGASGFSKDFGFGATRQEMYRLAQLIFSGNPKDREYFLGQGADSLAEVIEKNGALKPCIHGSDAHSAAKLFAPDMDRFCWIKADPTFEGLRQLLHEPGDRVYIGPTPPAPLDDSKVIETVEFVGESPWFKTKVLQLNPGLCGIIGEKGSGKTALAELVAYACRAWDGQTSLTSFIKKAADLLDGLKVRITWKDGSQSEEVLGQLVSGDLPSVRYLSQDFVEKLCSEDHSGRELVQRIEEVIFSYINEADRLDASSFADLRSMKTQHLSARKSGIRDRIVKLNGEIVELEDKIATRPDKEQVLAKHKQDIEAIDEQLPRLQQGVDAAVAEKLKIVGELLQQTSAELAQLKKRLSRIDTAKQRAADYERLVNNEFESVRRILQEVGFTEDEISAFRPEFAANRNEPFSRLAVESRSKITALEGDPNHPVDDGESLADLTVRQKALEALIATDEQQRKRLVNLQKRKTKLAADVKRLEKEIAQIDGKVTKDLSKKRAARFHEYGSYFELLEEEREALVSLYEPLQGFIAQDESGETSGFELNVKLTADAEAWLENGQDLFNKTRWPAIVDPNLVERLRKELFPAWVRGSKNDVLRAAEDLLNALGEPSDIDDVLRKHSDRKHVYNWLFATEYIQLSYGLRYQGTDLEVLSPGTRGIVLLVLYLAMDRHDTRPLIIDQPEGNLDNSSIYDALVPFLRRAKRGRQIILVSHNPNLVVTTDAEQVIVATAARSSGTAHPQISYQAGSLENAETDEAIRAQALRLLEGGREPFKMRENRYSI